MSFENHTWRILCKSLLNTQDDLEMEEDEHHYIHNVLRLKIGDKIDLSDCLGNLGQAVIKDSNKKKTVVSILEITSHKRPSVEIHLFLGLPKPTALEEVVATCAELGVSALHLFRTEKCQSKAPVKIEKLERISREATRVNKSAWAAEIIEHASLERFLNRSDFLMPSVLCDESPLHAVEKIAHPGLLKTVQTQGVFANASRIGVFVGPESSFSASERNAICAQNDVFSVSLGDLILRVPTACSAAVATLIQSTLQK